MMIAAMPRRRRPDLAALAALALATSLGLAAAAPAVAEARAERVVSHAYDRVWPTAVRFLAVDEKLKVVDKDPDAGYVVFELTDKGKTFRGALELVKVADQEGRKAVRLVVTIDGRPEYTEAGLLDRLLDKVHAEYGDPAPAPEPPTPPPAKGAAPKK